MKKAAAIFLSALMCALFSLSVYSLPSESTDAHLSVSAQSAVLTDASDNAVLYAKNADKRMPMASTTKIMTALVAVENCDINKKVKIPQEAVGIEGSSVYLYAGEIMTLEDLLYAMLLASANDAAAAIAIEVGGSIDGFCELMNRRAETLGLHDTHFTNPHGLHNDEHYTTARELAVIAAAALSDKTVRKIVSTQKKTIVPIEGNTRVVSNHNKMLRLYDGAIGVKTGFTKTSGRCLVSAAEREGLTLIAVTLNAPDDWNDHTLMLDYGFSRYESVVLAEAGGFTCYYPVTGGTQERVLLSNTSPLYATLPRDREEPVAVVESVCRFAFAPVSEGSVLARVRYFCGDECIAESELVCTFDVARQQRRSGLFSK